MNTWRWYLSPKWPQAIIKMIESQFYLDVRMYIRLFVTYGRWKNIYDVSVSRRFHLVDSRVPFVGFYFVAKSFLCCEVTVRVDVGLWRRVMLVSVPSFLRLAGEGINAAALCRWVNTNTRYKLTQLLALMCSRFPKSSTEVQNIRKRRNTATKLHCIRWCCSVKCNLNNEMTT